MTLQVAGVCQIPNFKAQQGALRIGEAHAFRLRQLESLDDALNRGKQLQRDKALGQVGVRLMGDDSEVDWKTIYSADPKRFEDAVATFVVHIGPQSGPSLCGATTGRVAADPSTVTLLKDRWCSRCWNRWAKQRAA